MNYTIETVRIETLGLTYNIRVYNPEVFLGDDRRRWDSKESFDYTVARKCVEYLGDLVRMAHQLGCCSEKSPKAIIAEVAESALERNPHFRAQNPEFAEMSEIERKRRETAKKQSAQKVVLDDLELKTLQNAKKGILRLFGDLSDSEIAGKLDIPEKSVKTLKSRNWTFRDCLKLAEKLDLDVEIVFGRFRQYR